MRRPVLDRAWLEKESPARWVHLVRLSGAILANALALLLAFFLGGEDEAAPMISFMAGVMAASWLGGRLVGLAAVVFSTWAANYLVFTPGSLAVDFPDDFLRLAAFSAVALVVSGVNSSRAALERSEQRRERAERARRWAEEVLEQGLAPVLLLHPETGQVLFDNQAARELAGGRHPVVRGVPAVPGAFFTAQGHTVPPEEMPAARAARGEKVAPMRLEWHLPEGTRKLLVSARRLERTPEHEPLVLLSYQDFTEADTAAEALRRSEALYETLADSAPVGIFHVDTGGQVLYANERAADLLRIGADEESVRLDRLTAPGWTEDCDLASELAAGTPVSFECRLVGSDREDRWLGVGLSPLRDGGDRVISYVGTVDDLTPRKRAEEELKELSEQRAELVTTVSHALRGPIAAMLANLDMVQDAAEGRLEAQERRFVELAVRSALDLSGTVDDILSLSRLQTGRARVTLEPASAAELAGRVYERMLPRAMACEVALELEVAGHGPVSTDPGELEGILNELVENAIKYTPRGGRVILSVEETAESVRMAVRDTGPGLDPNELTHLFEPFYRGEAANRTQAKGSGLGLPIAARTAALLNGILRAGSHPEGGALFELVLPRTGDGSSTPSHS